MAEMNEQMNAW